MNQESLHLSSAQHTVGKCLSIPITAERGALKSCTPASNPRQGQMAPSSPWWTRAVWPMTDHCVRIGPRPSPSPAATHACSRCGHAETCSCLMERNSTILSIYLHLPHTLYSKDDENRWISLSLSLSLSHMHACTHTWKLGFKYSGIQSCKRCYCLKKVIA